jgi:uncharacterized DUF497 family protein
MDIKFEWDADKEERNIEKHGISFVAAANLLLSLHYEARSDRKSEERYLAIGEVGGHVLAVAYARRSEKYRIISARRASKHEKATYKKNCKLLQTRSSF